MKALQPVLDAPHCLDAIVSFAECRQADVTFSAGAETDSRSSHYIGFVQHLVEETPRTGSIGSLYPQIRCVYSSVYFQSGGFQSFFHDAGVCHIIIDRFLYLFFPLGAINRLCGTLGNVRRSVELGALAAVHIRFRGMRSPSSVAAVSSFGTTVYPQRIPVKPAVFEKLRNSMAHFWLL